MWVPHAASRPTVSSTDTLDAMAADIPTRDPGEKPEPQSFGELLKTLREGAGLSQRQAATRCDISQARWAQVERGYVRGTSDKTAPGADFVVKVADYFDQDRDKLLALAGIDPATVRTEPPIEVPPSALMDVWPDLNENERLALVIQARLYADRNSVVTWSNLLGDREPQDTAAPSRVVTDSTDTSSRSRT